MRIVGERRIAAPRREVLEALRDHAVIAACLPGCVRYEPDGETAAAVVLAPRIGPLRADIEGRVTSGLAHAPERFRLEAESRHGPAGIARGSAMLSFRPAEHDTIVGYEIDATVGGKLAQLGATVVESAARRLIDGFAERLDTVMAERRAPRVTNAGLYPDAGVADPRRAAEPATVPTAAPPPAASARATPATSATPQAVNPQAVTPQTAASPPAAAPPERAATGALHAAPTPAGANRPWLWGVLAFAVVLVLLLAFS